MASSGSSLGFGKRRLSNEVVPTAKRLRVESSSAPVLGGSTELLGAILGDMGLVISPPLPLAFQPFRFLVCVDLSSIGLNLCEIPFDFGWELQLWNLDGESGVKIAQGSSELVDRVFEVDDQSCLSDDDSDEVHETGGSWWLSGLGKRSGLNPLGLKLSRKHGHSPCSCLKQGRKHCQSHCLSLKHLQKL